MPSAAHVRRRWNTLTARVPSPRRVWQWVGVVCIASLLFITVTRLDLRRPTYQPTWTPDLVNVPSVFHDLDDAYGGDFVRTRTGGRVLITGGGGMIGKQVIARLLAANTPITVLDTIFYDDEVDALRKAYPKAAAKLRIVHGDIRDSLKLKEAMTEDVVGVINLAAVSRVLWCLENEADCMDVNVRGAEKVVEALKRGWFIQASSREVYGQQHHMPVPEKAHHDAANVYGVSKARAEAAIKKHALQVAGNGDKNLNVVFLRFSNVYGSAADHRERLIPAIMTNALSHRPIQIVGGNQNLDMVYIGDVVNAIALAVNRLNGMSAENSFGSIEAFNIGTDKSTSATALIRKILWLTNSSSPIQTLPGDDRFPDRYVGETKHAAAVLGFTAQVGIDEGLHRLATAYISETRDYLYAKRQSLGCDKPKQYSTRDLLALDGCSGILTAESDGQAFHAFFDEGKDGKPDKWGWRDEDEPQPWDFTIKKQGFNQILLSLKREVKEGHSVSFEVPNSGRIFDSETKFVAKVEPSTGYLSLSIASTGAPLEPWEPLPPPGRRDLNSRAKQSTPYRFRITPFCCADKPTPWPFFRDDPLASGILDMRTETTRPFNASQIGVLCERLSAAERLAATRLDRLKGDERPIQLQEAKLPTGRPADWRVRNLDICTNLCDHPTVCVDTGSCACGQSSCVPRPRFPFAAYANLPDLSYPPAKIDWEDITATDPAALVAQVEKASWLNVLRPHARRYLSRKPAFPEVAMAPVPADVEKDKASDPDKYQRVQTEWHGCFSADNVMERGAKAISKNYNNKKSLVFLPYYAYNGGQRFPDVPPWVQNGLKGFPKDIDVADVLMPFTFDWGRCNTILHNLYRVRQFSSTPKEIERASTWAPMGDLNSPCYFMDQDIVIPPRTCLQEELRQVFGNIANVKPSRQRSILVTFKGSPNGAGASVREKIVCERPYKSIHGKLFGANTKQRYWGQLKPGADYMDTIGDTVFCPLPRGTTGWATRTSDVIYAGCIPVLLGDQTHHPFWDMLDWSKFSVTVPDYEVQNLEAILLSYSWAEVQAMQTNLMLIRDAFLYPAEGDEPGLKAERGPFYFAIHAAHLLKQTKFPV